MQKKKICIVISAAMNLNSLYKDQFKFLMEHEYEVTGVAAGGIEHEWLKKDGVKTKVIPFVRTPSPFKDMITLLQLSWFFVFNRFDIVSISSPKASLLGSIAASITFQKNIVYTIRGRAYEDATGYTRKFYEFVERFICGVSKKVFCISHEIKDDFIRDHLCHPQKIFVIGSGSSNGVDIKKFNKTEEVLKKGKEIRNRFHIKPDELLILFSGRIRKDKGINELVRAFVSLAKKYPKLHLLIQGKYETFDPLDIDVIEIIKSCNKIHEAGWEREIVDFYAAADIFAFPSHREGFGNVAIEASAMELPVVGFNVVGCRESIKNGVSGYLCENICYKSLEKGIEQLILNEDERIEMGKNGRQWVKKEFDSKIIWQELLKVYEALILSSKVKI